MVRLFACVLLLSTGSALAGDPSPEVGAGLFADHCASCHGAEATGGGPLAVTMGIAAPDLTGLAAAAGGFPLVRVVEVIEGRAPVPGHGTAMPAFGPLMTGEDAVLDGPGGEPVRADLGILSLAAWLEGVQRP